MTNDIEINDEEAERLVRELAAITGEDEETAILVAVREKIERLKKPETPAGLAE
jgi:hypothetical protein